MKAMKSLLGVALAATALTVGTAAQAAQHSGGGHSSGGGWHGGGGGHGGGWHGGGYHGGYWHGGHYHYYSSVGFYWGWPAYWGPWWWGYPAYYYPYYGGYYYPYPADGAYGGYPAAPGYEEGTMPPSDFAPANNPGSPTQAPAYMNYCESAKAYFPKVTTCPEGWKFVTPQ